MSLAFLSFPSALPSRRQAPMSMCDARPPNDPTDLRTESQRRRNSPPKPLRRRRRRDTDPIDWDSMTSVPLVRPEARPESGEDYWWELDKSVKLGDPDLGNKPRKKREIDPNLKTKLRDEVVSPYTQNWILRVALLVLVLVVAVWVFGGEDTVPIIKVPDL